MNKMEVWGGIETTVNRVGDIFFTQLERNGHHSRHDDVERLASLGIHALRYPVLWERVAPVYIEEPDWSWVDDRLKRLRECGIRIIAGLTHHGSGPHYTSLTDPSYPMLFAKYARMVAERYPWLDAYTPVNEPLTTARFSGLYGVWYPHGKDVKTLIRALFNQCRATVLAMREIRKVNPAARLVQTEDLGKTFSTPALDYQAQHDNEMRWLSWDLLTGRVVPGHALWNWLIEQCGASVRDLTWFANNSCPPQIIGVNHYITSERFLDENSDEYPQRNYAWNHRESYTNIEAARALAVPTGGMTTLLGEVWERYQIPIAITEIHIDATRDNQLRWFAEIWQAAHMARKNGADVQAVTAWGLFGLFDWHCLVTREHGYYEPGAFDVRGPQPRETAIGKLVRDLAHGKEPSHPVLAETGWWRRDTRFFCEPTHAAQPTGTRPPWPWAPTRPVLITGAGGTLGRAFARLCTKRGLAYRLLSRNDMDIADVSSVKAAIDRYKPWAVINAAGYVRVDDAETDVARCFRENTVGPHVMSKVCADADIQFITFSSDLVFDGAQVTPYVETDGPAPLNVYGASKAEAEKRVLRTHEGSLVIRTSSFFGPWDNFNYLATVVKTMQAGRPFIAADDITVSPTYVPDLVDASLDLLIDGEKGIWHLSNGQPVTWADFATRAVERVGLDPALLEPRSGAQLRLPARRPAYSALSSERITLMPSLDSAIDRYFEAEDSLFAA